MCRPELQPEEKTLANKVERLWRHEQHRGRLIREKPHSRHRLRGSDPAFHSSSAPFDRNLVLQPVKKPRVEQRLDDGAAAHTFLFHSTR